MQNWGTQKLSPTKSQAATERFMFLLGDWTPAGQELWPAGSEPGADRRAAATPPDREFREMSSSCSASLDRFLERARKSG